MPQGILFFIPLQKESTQNCGIKKHDTKKPGQNMRCLKDRQNS